ncbi:hypothetical protein TWF718_009873 [Orbilia javanica]|uniref:Uncharacterized protein n=1 Tax=Orbilia javanica TaxID=47235 RepID=A0AAN8NR73_9PEZI
MAESNFGESPFTKFLPDSVKLNVVKQKCPVFLAIGDAVYQRREFIERAYMLKGGWEGWLQVELACCLPDYFQGGGGTIFVDREIEMKDSKADVRVDLEVSSGGTEFLVELKCQSFSNSANFLSGLTGDVTKIRNYNEQNNGKFLNGGVVGIYVAGDVKKAQDYCLKKGFTAGVVKECNMIVFFKPF